MTQITFTLNTACSDVQAEGATMAAAGENQTVAFTVLPGRNADCTLTMQAESLQHARCPDCRFALQVGYRNARHEQHCKPDAVPF